MTAFVIEKGTLVTAVRHLENGKFRYGQIITKQENMFFREDIVLDPIGGLTDESAENAGPILLSFLHSDKPVYGFRRFEATGERSEWTLLVDAMKVVTG